MIGQLKEEALELSRLLEIDEVAALRTVVLEYQSRPARDLASASTGLEDARDDERVEPVLSEEEKKEKIFFDRLLLCLSERKYVIKVATFLLRVSQAGTKNDLWKDIGRRYVMEGIIEKGGNAIKVVESIGRRWTENTRVPGWLKARVGGPYEDEMIFIWEKQVCSDLASLPKHANSSIEHVGDCPSPSVLIHSHLSACPGYQSGPSNQMVQHHERDTLLYAANECTFTTAYTNETSNRLRFRNHSLLSQTYRTFIPMPKASHQYFRLHFYRCQESKNIYWRK